MPGMLTRGQSGCVEVLLEVPNADFLQLWGGGQTSHKGQGLGHGIYLFFHAF